MNTDKKKILVVGSSAKEFALVKKLSANPKIDKIFVAPANTLFADIAECVDIREDKPAELLDFVLENAIDLTIATSSKAINSDIVGIFSAGAQMIFAPSLHSANITLSKAYAKKFLYKNRIPTPKFAIFDKLQLALDYLKSANYPLIIKCDNDSDSIDRLACTNISLARSYIEELFQRGEKKVIIEDYVYGHDFTFYVITDGYQVLPIASVADYKFLYDGDGGLFTTGVGAYAPDYKISSEFESVLMNDVAMRVVNSLEKNGTPYVGILGFDLVLKPDNDYVVTGFKSFFQEHDADLVLELIDEDLIQLFIACVVGSFADDYEFISLNNKSGVSCVVSSTGVDEKVIEGLDNLDEHSLISFIKVKKNEYFEYLTQTGKTFVLTRSASTLSRARNLLYDDLACIKFNGIHYRKDICSPVK